MQALSLVDELHRRAEAVRLTPAHRRILSYLVAHAHEALFLSTQELASAVGVSQPSVTRLARALGFGGYAGLREAMQEWTRDPDVGDQRGKAGRIINLESAQVASLGDQVASQVIDGLGADLMGSPQIVIAGWRASKYLQHYLAYFARKIHTSVVEIGDDDLDVLARARRAGATHVIFLVMPRYPRAAIGAIQVAQRLGYSCVIITDALFTPPAPTGPSDVVVRLPVGSGTVFDAHPAVLVFLSLLLESMCDSDVRGVDSLLESLEDDAEQLETYWS
ncbi:MurR/RpiR family transcriptional regulator [Microbacterium sp. SA39]|uniref:MurR/RpiR family transcriptional regulator n=1 Tax=Microbacterium sp. SA39 TaxID=1263625 RepID=UPI0005F9D044|nr:MurR/RpiR family transcriptional regulator [Microbacterium sp. SA39]KJQ52759.1 putative DNA-binding transcriptional regulator [Microbacterium sp. SA39]